VALAKLYTTRWCPYCVRARMLLSDLGVEFDEIDVGAQPELRREMMDLSGRHTVPQIWIGDQHIGGFDDMNALHRAGQLVPLIESTGAATKSNH